MNSNLLEPRNAINIDIVPNFLFNNLLNKKSISIRNFDPI